MVAKKTIQANMWAVLARIGAQSRRHRLQIGLVRIERTRASIP